MSELSEILCDYCWLVRKLNEILGVYYWLVRKLNEILCDSCWLVGKLNEILKNYSSRAQVASCGRVWPPVAPRGIGPTYVLKATYNQVRV